MLLLSAHAVIQTAILFFLTINKTQDTGECVAFFMKYQLIIKSLVYSPKQKGLPVHLRGSPSINFSIHAHGRKEQIGPLLVPTPVPSIAGIGAVRLGAFSASRSNSYHISKTD